MSFHKMAGGYMRGEADRRGVTFTVVGETSHAEDDDHHHHRTDPENRTKKMTKKKKKRPRDEIPAMRRLGSDLAHLGDSAAGGKGDKEQSDANTEEESKHRRKDYPHIHTPAKPHLLKQGSESRIQWDAKKKTK